MTAITIEGVSKAYGTKLALDNVSFEIQQGRVFALLGPNGAGKTTLMKSLLGLTQIQKGDIKIFGVSHKNSEARAKVGYLPEKFNFYPYYTVENTLAFFAGLYGIPRAERKDRVIKVIDRLGLSDIRKQKNSTLSKGQLQRVGLAGTLVGDTDLLCLDEPFSGLDPIIIKELKDLVLELKNEGKTILINSHILGEVEKMADDLAIIHEGTCRAKGPIQQLRGEQNLEDFFYKIIKGQ